SPTVQALGEPSIDFKRVQLNGAGILIQDQTPDHSSRFRIEDDSKAQEKVKDAVALSKARAEDRSQEILEDKK
ncbi:MAG: hypothetical protein MJA83_13885, partial [Gammaproteobacteria bacterium]|nr:hypothetical protein [Gammaproteobacteria bacterium]